jgi:hypothetical protein
MLQDVIFMKDNVVRISDAERNLIMNIRGLNVFELKDLLNQLKSLLMLTKITDCDVKMNLAEYFIENLQGVMDEIEEETVKKLSRKSPTKHSNKVASKNTSNDKTEKDTADEKTPLADMQNNDAQVLNFIKENITENKEENIEKEKNGEEIFKKEKSTNENPDDISEDFFINDIPDYEPIINKLKARSLKNILKSGK